MAIGGLAICAGLSAQSSQPGGALAVLRKHVFVDTTMCHAALIRAAVDVVGASNVIAGSDFPIVDAPIRGRLTDAMQKAGLSDEDQRALAARNAQRLLGVN